MVEFLKGSTAMSIQGLIILSRRTTDVPGLFLETKKTACRVYRAQAPKRYRHQETESCQPHE